MLNVGFGNYVAKDKIVVIMSPESAPIKRLVTNAKLGEKLIDLTYGRRTRAIIITTDGQVILASSVPETLAGRFAPISKENTREEDELT